MLAEKLGEARARLIAAGISEAEASVDVDLYARTILGWDRARLLIERGDGSPPELEPRFSEWIARRASREPSAYIVGLREFWGLDFAVTPAVLIPRPETEFVVEEALALLASGGPGASDDRSGGHAPRTVRVADIGTGSGCLAVALAHDVSDCRVLASDLSPAALAVARTNAERHGVADRIDFVCASYLQGVEGTFDLIVANPPYVKDGDGPALSRDVRHEPQVALFGGPDGLRDIGGVLETAWNRLASGGWLVMEFGFGQDEDVRELVGERPGLCLRRIRCDVQGIPRTAVVERI